MPINFKPVINCILIILANHIAQSEKQIYGKNDIVVKKDKARVDNIMINE